MGNNRQNFLFMIENFTNLSPICSSLIQLIYYSLYVSSNEISSAYWFYENKWFKKKWSFIASKISLKCFSLVDYKIDLFLGSITMMLSEKEEFVISTQVQFYHFHSCKKWVCFMRYIYTRLYIIGNKELLSTKMKNIYGINQDAIFIYVNIDWKMFYVCVIT